MTLHQARKLGYDVKARSFDSRLIWSGHLDQAIFVLESGRAVEHKRDSDCRLAKHIRSLLGYGDDK